MASTEESSAPASSSGKGTDQKSEVASIKAAFPNRCRVICDIGQYSNVVTVQPEDIDATIKFQLTAAYPTVIPEIAIRSESLSEGQSTDVVQVLRSKASEMIGKPMIQVLIKEAETQLKAMGLRKGEAVDVNGHTYLNKKKPKTKKPKRKPESEDEVEDNKLPSMKTADDVVKRIIWDDALEKDDFIVGYFDRFRGLVEKYFSVFSWKDLATVDYDVLAVPKHRIQYFKYKDVKVWDKPRRIDNVFGSADGTKTIDVVIKEVEERERQKQAGQGTEAQNGAESSAEPAKHSSETDEDDDDYDESSNDDDDDDGIMVTIGSSANIGLPVQAEGGAAAVNAESNVKKGEKKKFDPYWRDKLRPNYFLCVRITNEEIIDKIGNIQDYLMEKEPLYKECCIPGASLHVTLCMLGLDTPDQLLQCIDVLKRIKPDLESALPTSVLRLHGVSHFYNRIIYAKINHKKDFLEFCNLLKMLLKEAGVSIRDGYDFVPHTTIIKTNRPGSRAIGTKNIDPELYAKFTESHFGEQKVDKIYLCSMGNERRDDGFYLTPLELELKG